MNTWTEMERNINKKYMYYGFYILKWFFAFFLLLRFQSHGEMRNVRDEVVQVEAATAKNVHNC